MTNKKRKTDRKETLKKLNKKLFEENLNRLLYCCKNKFFFSHIIFLSLISTKLTHSFLQAVVEFIIFHAPVWCDQQFFR